MYEWAIKFNTYYPGFFEMLNMRSMVTDCSRWNFVDVFEFYKRGDCLDYTGVCEAEVKRLRTGEKPVYRIKAKSERINTCQRDQK